MIRPAENIVSGASLVRSAEFPIDMTLDGRCPILLDHHGYVFEVVAGHLDIFAVDTDEGEYGKRHHLFRIESGDIVADLPEIAVSTERGAGFIAVGTEATRASARSRSDLPPAQVMRWIERLARFVAGPAPLWQMPELPEGKAELAANEAGRGLMRGLLWLTVERGDLRLMGISPPYAAGSQPLPLTSGLWVEAGAEGCGVVADGAMPAAIWPAVDQFHQSFAACVQRILVHERQSESERLMSRNALAASQSMEAFDRLSGIIVRRFDHEAADASYSDRLAGACQLVGSAMRMPIAISGRADGSRQEFAGLTQIALDSRLRLRQVLLRSDWWRTDAGPLVGWFGEKREPVALVYEPRRGYVMIDPLTKARLSVNRSVAAQIAPEAAMLYPPLPSSSLKFRELLQFALRYARGSGLRIALVVVVIGLLSLVTPFVTNLLISSIIPRSELDQLVFCGLALGLTALSVAGVQVMQGLVMLRMEALIDWRLQSAMIDRILRLPTAVFRKFTTGELVDRATGIDAARRALTGHAVRGMIAGLFCIFSLGLMIYYSPKLALLAIGLTFVRAAAIISTNLLRLYFENKHFNQQGKVSGFVLQLLTGVGKLRVSGATGRALGIWSRQFATQKQYFVSSQLASNGLGAFETAFPTIATLIIFGYASYSNSNLLTDLGRFFAFFSAFGQSMGAVGSWAGGVSEALIAIPPLLRLRPLIASPTEISDDRKAPGELSGSVELARVSFRYLSSGPLVLDNVSLKIAPGEYVAIVGPSGSGKSSLFRLLLGFEWPESGAVFYDGKSIETLDVSALRRQLGVVLQSARLANGNIYENICGGLRLPLDQVWDAARLAGIEEDIKAMPMGMLTQISEGVSTLSGGQRQRIMIARAIARRPRVLLFDEATSSLDNRSQAIVSDALENLNVTRIVIAHRLSTVRNADRIIVLVDGKIVEAGTFEELTAAAGAFAAFAQRQML
ncbi:NHLP bacteriocin export ABC transporter permease/ATPase subunit [Bradyrhizobium sp. WYCCWR 13023]|uniref:NHLP bacteriocin export ABC transporter permease/ATPase subunit n=2 Tax=Bradyrhizobium TaxID=374 RepID=A0A9X1RHQ0_9BRAD|nr:NHLP bacteriocin export ABC transporter permease/ATPase subunit [Bradyrhizobium zhengyangense]MCG2632899.1 NHLP bacteriocin export ABC transporter permease/ATPase subunit [Bradyrhizobium zhengyangense]MCG2673071.1 NHLP bacteriocin export ABC transporter permease/ATPase subunit [Bradyrhizobium zhengyangense]MDA9521601.1 ABC transporter [Bradyrhizobium sp. CCBAU 11434]